MPFIIGRARQEDELYRRYKDFITGVAWQHRTDFTGTGNGKLVDVRVQEGYEYETFTLTCVSESAKSGSFSVEGSVSGTLPDATCNQVYHQDAIQFYIDYGTTDFKLGDTFVVTCRDTSSPTKPLFDYIKLTPKSETTTTTLTCTKDGTDQTPAEFSVVTSTGGNYGTYIQGVEFVSEFFTFLIPHQSGEQFTVGDNLQFHVTENELKAVNQHWEHIVCTQFNEGSTQFGNLIEDRDHVSVFKGRGLAGENEVFHLVERSWSTSKSYAYWELSFLSGYNPDLHWQEQPGIIQDDGDANVDNDYRKRPIHHFWDGELYYWIIANGRRVIVCTKSNNYYHQSYTGLYIPFASPQYEPYPVITGGSGTKASLYWNSTSSYNSNFWYPRTANSSYRTQLRLKSSSGSEVEIENDQSTRSRETFPYSHKGMQDVTKNLDGTFPAFRVGLYPNWGEMDGVYAVPGRAGQQSENLLDYGDKKMVVFNNIYRLGTSDFVAMELS